MRSRVSFLILSRGSTLKTHWAPLLLYLFLMHRFIIFVYIDLNSFVLYISCIQNHLYIYNDDDDVLSFSFVSCVLSSSYFLSIFVTKRRRSLSLDTLKKGKIISFLYRYLIHLNRKRILNLRANWEEIFEIIFRGRYSFELLNSFFIHRFNSFLYRFNSQGKLIKI